MPLNLQGDIQARLMEVRNRVQNLRPNLLPQLQTALQQRGMGQRLQRIQSRVQSLRARGVAAAATTPPTPALMRTQFDTQSGASGFRPLNGGSGAPVEPKSGFRMIT